MMQTILGSGGGIGIPLARELINHTEHIRLVSRNPQKINDSDELFPADLRDPVQIDQAIAGSQVVYLVIGFTYRTKVWEETWPPFMASVIASCKKHGSKLVFFDNVYMYDKAAIPHMTEESRIQAPSRKGQVRQGLHKMLMKEVEQGDLNALIARGADFYGPENRNSVFTVMVAENLMKGKKAQVFGELDNVHTYTYTPDAAKATALLGNTPDAFNQVWHVPTTRERWTQRQWIEQVADELKVVAKTQIIPAWMLKMSGIFMPVMRELPEMYYQYDRDYVFDSSKFETRFGLKATAPEEGISHLVQSLKHSI